MSYEPHEQRVVEEHQDLCEKIKKLRLFFKTEIYATLPDEERSLMIDQNLHMSRYAGVLARRIELFGGKADG